LVTESPVEILQNLRTAIAAHEAKTAAAAAKKEPDDGGFSHKLELVEEFLGKPDEDLGEREREMRFSFLQCF
jgi:hypothetical protein